MVKLENFSVKFSDNMTVYSPGDIVSGELEVQLDGTMEMKEIRIKLSGKAHVTWNEGKHNYSAKERFFTEQSIVHGGDSGGSNERVSLTEGKHVFPFRFQLPSPLASSYEDKVGYIRYYVKARIEKPWQLDNKTIAVITVLDTLNLNHLTNMMAPSGGSETKNLCCWCCANGPIEGEVQVDRKGYVPGEWVIANASLKNYSSSRVRQTSLEFVKIVTYYTAVKNRTDVISLVKEFGPECKSRGEVNLNNVKLQLPPVPPTEAAHCNIIDIQYAIMLMGHLRTCAINLRAYAPIVIGTVPLNNLPMYNDLPVSERPEASKIPVVQPQGSSASTAPTTNFGLQPPPPSYTAATTGSFDVRGKDENTMGDHTYTPKYTYYDWNQSAFTYT